MPVVEVSCPHCAAKLKAPDDRIGKKAKCKKCGEAFRVPGAPPADSVGDQQIPTALSLADDGDDRTEVVSADQVPKPKPKPAPPAKDVASLPSADAFDFAKPAAPAKPAFGSAKAAPAPPPVAPAKPASAAKPAKPAKPPEPEEEDEPEPPKPKAKAKPAPEPEPPPPAPVASPFAFAFGDDAPEEAETPRRKQRREAADLDEDFEEKPRAKKRRDDDEEDDEKPRKKKREEEDDEDKPRKKKRDDEEDDEKPRKKKRAAGDEPDGGDEDGKPRYLRPDEKGSGMGKAVMLTGLAGALALALGITAIIVYVKQNKPAEPTKKDEKKEDPIPDPPVPIIPPKDGKVDPKKPKDPDPKKPKEAEPKPKDPDPKPKEVVEPKPKEVVPPDAKLRNTFGFPPTVKTFSLAPPAAAPNVTDRAAGASFDLDAKFEDIKAIYPPRRKDDDMVAVVRGAAADKWAIDVYSGVSGRKATHIEITGAAQFTDVSADRKQVLAIIGTAATVMDLEKNAKLLDAADVYADKPDHKKAGLAAAVFLGDPDSRVFTPTGKLLLVSTAGAVSVYDMKAKAITDEFVPTGGRPGQVALGRSLAVNNQSIGVVMDLDGVLHDVEAAPTVTLARKIDLTGRVVRSLGLAAERGKGRVVYAFELDKAGKSERGVMYLPPDAADLKAVKLLRWPDAAGEPTGAFLAHSDVAGVTTAGGVVLFETNRETGALNPLGLARADKQLLATGDEDRVWYTAPDPAKPGASYFRGLGLPLDGFDALAKPFQGGKPSATFRLDKTGLAK